MFRSFANVKNVFTIIAVALLLSGCAVSSEFRAKSEPAAVGFEEQKGVLMIKGGSNRNIGTFFGKWQMLTVRNIDSDKTYSISDRSTPSALHSLFVGSLPPGTYQLERFNSESHGYISLYSSADAGVRFGRFRIESGRVTDLGSILYIRPYYPINTSAYRLMFIAVPEESKKSIELLAPMVAQSANQGTLGWLPLSDKEQRPILVPAREKISLFLNSPQMTPDGVMLFGEALGQIARRDKHGVWDVIHTGTINTITALLADTDGTILAGTEQSLLLVKRPNDTIWKTLSLPLKSANIRFVGKHPKLGYVVVAQDQRNIVALTTQDLAAPNWVELKRIPVELYLNSMQDTRFHAFLVKDSLIISTFTPAFTVKSELHAFDINKNEWEVNNIDFMTGGPDVFSTMPDGAIYVMGGPNISQTFYVSRDNGKTWEKRASPNWSGPAAFRGNQQGFTIRIENIPLFDAEKLTNSIWKTDDGGRTWSNAGSVPNQSEKIIILQRDDEMLMSTRNGQLFFSNDNGKTWRLERNSR